MYSIGKAGTLALLAEVVVVRKTSTNDKVVESLMLKALECFCSIEPVIFKTKWKTSLHQSSSKNLKIDLRWLLVVAANASVLVVMVAMAVAVATVVMAVVALPSSLSRSRSFSDLGSHTYLRTRVLSLS